MTAPFLGTNPTKESIVELLSEEYPLTAKKIYNRLKKTYKIIITYQATHKSLQELLEKGVLIKKKEGYLVNKEWIQQLSSFSRKIKQDLEGINQKREVKTLHKITFRNHSEFVAFSIDLMEHIMKKDKRLKITFLYRHVPYPNVLSKEDIQRLKKIMPKVKWTIFAKSDTPLDKLHAKQWKKFGVSVKAGADITTDRTIVINDHIIQVYISKKAIQKWDKLYSIKKISDFDIPGIIEDISSSKYKTVATITQDKELAKILSEH